MAKKSFSVWTDPFIAFSLRILLKHGTIIPKIYTKRTIKGFFILQEEIFHDVGVVLTAAVWEVAGCKHNDGIQALTIVT